MKRVYVAEDSPTQMLRVQRILAAIPGLEVTPFGDGLEIYQAVLHEPPDLLLMDVILPTMQGMAVSRLLKFHEDYRHIPIVIFSSINEASVTEEVRILGADAYLHKPFTPEALQGQVRRFLELPT